MITHFGDCRIYQSEEVYGYASCDCGLMSDLRHIHEIDVRKIYPKYNEDFGRHESDAGIYNSETHCYEKIVVTEEEREATRKMLVEAFGIDCLTVEPPDPIKEAEEWEIIESVFGLDYVSYSKEKQCTNLS